MQKFVRVNDRIRVPEVRVIGADSSQLGVLPIKRALEIAEESGLDLVEVAPTAKPPVCRIMDYSKYKYEQEKKERRIKKSQKISHLKQIRLKPHIDEGDYQVKLKMAISFLTKHDKVRVNLFFRGREMAFRDQGKSLLERFVVDTQEAGTSEGAPKAEGRTMFVVIAPKSEKK
ncbi:MAG: translation initiation factor IF-3 [Candidatus Omnitrophota bacterium]